MLARLEGRQEVNVCLVLPGAVLRAWLGRVSGEDPLREFPRLLPEIGPAVGRGSRDTVGPQHLSSLGELVSLLVCVLRRFL